MGQGSGHEFDSFEPGAWRLLRRHLHHHRGCAGAAAKRTRTGLPVQVQQATTPTVRHWTWYAKTPIFCGLTNNIDDNVLNSETLTPETEVSLLNIAKGPIIENLTSHNKYDFYELNLIYFFKNNFINWKLQKVFWKANKSIQSWKLFSAIVQQIICILVLNYFRILSVVLWCHWLTPCGRSEAPTQPATSTPRLSCECRATQASSTLCRLLPTPTPDSREFISKFSF